MSSFPSKTTYNKKWKSLSDQVALFESRGLVVSDKQLAENFLRHTNYYRFSGYCLAFESSRHCFYQGTTFEQVQQAYEFDRVLRDIINEALEVVEIDFRTVVANHFGNNYGAFGHTTASHFFTKVRSFQHDRWIERMRTEAKSSKELFVLHFKQQYSEFPDLPIWVLTEIMSFGSLSRMCKGMHKKDQKLLSNVYRLQPHVWTSWLHHLTYVRNLCAHHARLWDRAWSIKPILPEARIWQPPKVPTNKRLFSTLLILRHLLNNCPTVSQFAAEWKLRVENIIDQTPTVPDASYKTGIPANWKEHPLWE